MNVREAINDASSVSRFSVNESTIRDLSIDEMDNISAGELPTWAVIGTGLGLAAAESSITCGTVLLLL